MVELLHRPVAFGGESPQSGAPFLAVTDSPSGYTLNKIPNFHLTRVRPQGGPKSDASRTSGLRWLSWLLGGRKQSHLYGPRHLSQVVQPLDRDGGDVMARGQRRRLPVSRARWECYC